MDNNRIAEKIEIETVMKYNAKILYLIDSEEKTRIERNLSTALGTAQLSFLELARAYGVIARGYRFRSFRHQAC